MSSSRHDFNNLVTVILNYAFIAREALPEDHPARRELAEVERATQRAIALVRGEAEPRPAEAPAGDAAATVLLADDDDALRRVTNRVLTRRGYRVLDAPTPAIALELCRAHDGPIDLLLTDYAMPSMSGSELAQEVLALHPGAQVVFMSGAGLPEGLNGPVLAKPFTPDGLLEAVATALALR